MLAILVGAFTKTKHINFHTREPPDHFLRTVFCFSGQNFYLNLVRPLTALEKIPGVGSLRSLNSVGSSQPSLTLDPRVVRRDESSHSISSGLSLALVRNSYED